MSASLAPSAYHLPHTASARADGWVEALQPVMGWSPSWTPSLYDIRFQNWKFEIETLAQERIHGAKPEAMPVRQTTVEFAIGFADALKDLLSGYPPLDVSLDSEGHFNFELYLSDAHQILMAVMEDGMLAYSVRNGRERFRGYTDLEQFNFGASQLRSAIRSLLHQGR